MYTKENEDVQIRIPNLYASLYSRIEKIEEKGVVITAPYDVNGEPFFLPLGSEIMLEVVNKNQVEIHYYTVFQYFNVIEYLTNNNRNRLPTLEIRPIHIQSQSTDNNAIIQREFFRAKVPMTIRLTVDHYPIEGKIMLADISGGGMGFYYNHPVPPQREVNGVLFLQEKNKIVELPIQGVIVNLTMIHTSLFRMGVRFYRIKNKEQEMITLFANRCVLKQRNLECEDCSLYKESICNGSLSHHKLLTAKN